MIGAKEQYKGTLAPYIPEKALDIIAEWLILYDFNLKITESRNTKLGDYRAPIYHKRHFITINHNLNKFAFLITLVHEIAHLTTWNKHKDKVKPHGIQWKEEYKILMQVFFRFNIFPEDIELVLKKYMDNPAASSCSDSHLQYALKKYDKPNSFVHLEQLSEGALFTYNENRFFKKGIRLRKRYKCIETSTNRAYLFNPLTEVKEIRPNI